MASTLSASERDALKEQLDRLAEEAPFNVLARDHLLKLAAIESDGAPIVSLYLNLSPRMRLKRAWAVALKTMAREALDRLPHSLTAEAAEAEILRIERALEERIPELERGVAVFACEEIDLWWLVPLPIRVRNRLEIARRPFLRPLTRIRDEHAACVIVLLDKRKARLLISKHGALFEVIDLFEDTPPHQKQGGWSQMRFQRHHDAHVMWHAGAVAHATTLLMEKFSTRYLLISGTREVLAEYKDNLPASAAGRLEGTFSVPIDATFKEISDAIGPEQERVEAREEEATISLIHEAVSRGRGVWGLAPTLRALVEQRVMTLLVDDAYHEAGSECLHCGLLTADEGGDCSGCGNPMHSVDHIVDLALERALDQEASIEIVRSPSALALLANAAPIGALLRF